MALFKKSVREIKQNEVYIARYTYVSTKEGDLTVSEDDEVEVLKREENGTCWRARNKTTGEIGIIPRSLVEIKPIQPVPDGTDSGSRGLTILGKYVALYDYEATQDGALSFQKNQKMEILDKAERSWWYAQMTRDGETVHGFVPSDYVTAAHSLVMEPWYYGTYSRQEAEYSLLLPFNNTGSFLIRESETITAYILSVRVEDKVKHYILRQDEQKRFCVSQDLLFETVQELVSYFQYNAGLCTVLKDPCEIEDPSVNMTQGKEHPVWEIDRSTITLGEKLGSGHFGEVRKGLWNNVLEVAIKMMLPESMKTEEFMAEAEIMQKLKHPRLVKLLGFCAHPKSEPLYIVCEFIKNGSLLEHLRRMKQENIKYHEGELLNMGVQVASGMAYLEKQNIVHRDLAARNVLIGEGINVKIADFGLARIMKDDYYKRKSLGVLPIKWTAPEALIDNIYTMKSDVWSYGILFYEIITYGSNPYPGLENREVFPFLQDGQRIPRPRSCPEKLYTLMLSCWKMDPVGRPTFQQIKFLLNQWIDI